MRILFYPSTLDRLYGRVGSTLAWEALLLGKPVVTLGNVFVNVCRAVRHCPDLGQLYREIERLRRDASRAAVQASRS